METAIDPEVPLSSAVKRIAILYNLKHGVSSAAKDTEAEYDSINTVNALRDVFERGGLSVLTLEADRMLPVKLMEARFDIAFNIAEGLSGRGREAQVPALLHLMGLRCTGSDETTLAIALNKSLTNRLLSTCGVRVPRSVVLTPDTAFRAPRLSYPVLIKPNCEGSSKGIAETAIAGDLKALRSLAEKNFELYGEEMLAEEYIEGREFTVGLLGNGERLRVFPPMEIVFDRFTEGDYHVYSYPVKQDYKRYVHYECPASLTPAQDTEMRDMARRAFEALGCRDFARVDFRMDTNGRLYFIEINPLPGLAPDYSDFPILAGYSGVTYDNLVRGVLDAAATRLGLRVEWEA